MGENASSLPIADHIDIIPARRMSDLVVAMPHFACRWDVRLHIRAARGRVWHVRDVVHLRVVVPIVVSVVVMPVIVVTVMAVVVMAVVMVAVMAMVAGGGQARHDKQSRGSSQCECKAFHRRFLKQDFFVSGPHHCVPFTLLSETC